MSVTGGAVEVEVIFQPSRIVLGARDFEVSSADQMAAGREF